MEDEKLEIGSEERGSHWVAWVIQGDHRMPAASVIMVGKTREEAEARIRQWWFSRR
jgi:hypothetical protein